MNPQRPKKAFTPCLLTLITSIVYWLRYDSLKLQLRATSNSRDNSSSSSYAKGSFGLGVVSAASKQTIWQPSAASSATSQAQQSGSQAADCQPDQTCSLPSRCGMAASIKYRPTTRQPMQAASTAAWSPLQVEQTASPPLPNPVWHQPHCSLSGMPKSPQLGSHQVGTPCHCYGLLPGPFGPRWP